jgi:hypothetical protein
MHTIPGVTDSSVTLRPAGAEGRDAAERWHATGYETPVFVSDHGRRALIVEATAAIAGVLFAVWLGALLFGALGFGRAALPGAQVFAGHGRHGPALVARVGTAIPRPATTRRTRFVALVDTDPPTVRR